MIHLDTSIVVAHLRGDQRVAERLHATLPNVAISTIVLAELNYGVKASARQDDNHARLGQFIELVSVVVFDKACAETYGNLRAELRRVGRQTGEADALIAATALTSNSLLVTHNVRHFEAIAGLRIEDWLA